jgi:hypothetical protein
MHARLSQTEAVEVARAGHPGVAVDDYPQTSALDARVEPVQDELKAPALISGRRLAKISFAREAKVSRAKRFRFAT